ncbi:MAG: DUF429 domain-containing protein [Pseudomonadota bacterium]
MRGTGVDGCAGGWFFVQLEPHSYRHGVVTDLSALANEVSPPERLFIDMPIGLADAPPAGRSCDRLARRVLGPRRSSVFATPARATLAAADYAQALTLNRAAVGTGLSKQAYHILPKIREVDELVRRDPHAVQVLYEAHPEVCFWALAGHTPMQAPKRTEAGFEERIAVLEQFWPGARLAVSAARRWSRGRGVARDDIVDAFVNALAASTRDLETFPDKPTLDAAGLPMRMCFGTNPTCTVGAGAHDR